MKNSSKPLCLGVVFLIFSGCAAEQSQLEREPENTSSETDPIINGTELLDGANIGGLNGIPLQFRYFAPGMVLMKRHKKSVLDPTYKYNCSATMITRQWFLTAKHCVCDMSINMTGAPASACDASDVDNPEYDYKLYLGTRWSATVQNIFVQPDEVLGTSKSEEMRDVALVRVDTPFPVEFERSLYAGTVDSLVGKTLQCYGGGPAASEADGAFPLGKLEGVRRVGAMKVATQPNCIPPSGTWFDHDLCMKSTSLHQQATRGDSGGSCVFEVNGRETIAGVASVGNAFKIPTSQVDTASSEYVASEVFAEWVGERVYAKTPLFSGATLQSGVSGYWVSMIRADSDEIPDLLEIFDDKLSVKRGNGDGTFGTATVSTFGAPFPTGWATVDAHVADLNGDSKEDFVFLGNTAIYSRINTNGAFGALQTTELAGSPYNDDHWATSDIGTASLAYINADAKLDFVYVSDMATYTLYGSSPSGNFESATLMKRDLHPYAGAWSQNTFFGKFDSDSKDDMIHVEPTRLVYRKGLGNGTFAAPIYSTFSTTTPTPEFAGWSDSYRLADVNHDSILDFIFIGYTEVYVSLGTATGSFGSVQRTNLELFNQWPDFAQMGDINGDGRDDLFMISGRNIWIKQSMGDGKFDRVKSFLFSSPYSWSFRGSKVDRAFA